MKTWWSNFWLCVRSVCRLIMEVRCQSRTTFRTQWRFSTTTVWPSAEAQTSSWSMMLLPPTASWGRYSLIIMWSVRHAAAALCRPRTLLRSVTVHLVERAVRMWCCFLSGGSLPVTEQTSGLEFTDRSKKAGVRKWLTCCRFFPANATTHTWFLRTAVSPARSRESVSLWAWVAFFLGLHHLFGDWPSVMNTLTSFTHKNPVTPTPFSFLLI